MKAARATLDNDHCNECCAPWGPNEAVLRASVLSDLIKRSAMDVILKLFKRRFALPDRPPGAHYYVFVKLHTPDGRVMTEAALYERVLSRCTCRHAPVRASCDGCAIVITGVRACA
jgi:hypothetical protein